MSVDQATFNLFDDEGDGKIDAVYVGTLARALGLKPTQAQVAKIVGEDIKKEGEKRFSLEEFQGFYDALSKEKEVGTYADYIEGLRVFDKDESGKIALHELRHALLALGERMTPDEVDDVIQDVADGDGNVNYEAWVKKMMAGPE